jgi:hypothetical protein
LLLVAVVVVLSEVGSWGRATCWICGRQVVLGGREGGGPREGQGGREEGRKGRREEGREPHLLKVRFVEVLLEVFARDADLVQRSAVAVPVDWDGDGDRRTDHVSAAQRHASE